MAPSTFTCCLRMTRSRHSTLNRESGLFTLRIRRAKSRSRAPPNGDVRPSPEIPFLTYWSRLQKMPYLLSEWRAHIQEAWGEFKAARLAVSRLNEQVNADANIVAGQLGVRE